jgi:hypothetical protein
MYLKINFENDLEIDYNHDTGLELGKFYCSSFSRSKDLRFFDIHIFGIVSSVSAQKLKFPCSPWFGTFIAQLSSSQKIQLELISTRLALLFSW